jgi:aminoglycoside phosphotransferase (APT) family kinase protein
MLQRIAADLVASRWGAAVTVDEVLVEHQDRTVMRTVDPLGRPAVIKADRDAGRLWREAKALAAAAAAGVPVPIVRERMDASPAILVLEYVDGRPLGSTSRPDQWRAVGRQLRRLHDRASPDDLPVFGGGESWWDSLRSLADWSHQWCRERQIVEPAALDRLAASMRAAFARDDPLGCLVHGDCGPYHWLLRDGTVAAVVDFGDAGRGDPCWDVAVLTLWDRHRLPAVLDGYGADEDTRDRLTAMLVPYTVVRHLLAVPWLVEHAVDPTPTVTELHRIAACLESATPPW